MNAIARHIAAAVELGLSPHLKAAGFRKRGVHFYKSDAGVIEAIDIQSSQYNMGDTGRFRVNAGIHFPQVAALLPDMPPMPAVPKEYFCILRWLVTALAANTTGIWWTIATSTDLNALAPKLAAHWHNDVFPWLQKNRSLPEAAKTFESAQQYWYAAAARLALAEPAEAERLLHKQMQLFASQADTPIAVNARLANDRLQKLREWAAAHKLKIR